MPENFCDPAKGMDWSIVAGDPITLDNWMVKFDLICASPFFISSFGIFFFAGMAIGALVLPALSDKNGRKKYFLAYFFT